MAAAPVGFKVTGPGQTYRGRHIGDWVSEFTNWLVTPDPNETSSPIRFARGSTYSVGGRYVPYDGTGNNGLILDTSMALLIDIISSTADDHYYSNLKTEADLRADVRRDIALTSNGTLYAKYSKGGGPEHEILDGTGTQLTDYLVETPLFALNAPAPTVGSSSPTVWDDVVLTDAFSANAVTVGIFLLLTFQAPGDYRFTFGGRGDIPFETNSTYDVTVHALPNTHVGTGLAGCIRK
jgi:hypothetical protein